MTSCAMPGPCKVSTLGLEGSLFCSAPVHASPVGGGRMRTTLPGTHKPYPRCQNGGAAAECACPSLTSWQCGRMRTTLPGAHKPYPSCQGGGAAAECACASLTSWQYGRMRTSLPGAHKFLPRRQGGGAETERAVVLIHGFGGGTFSWRLVMAPLAARAGCRIIALDRPGFG